MSIDSYCAPATEPHRPSRPARPRRHRRHRLRRPRHGDPAQAGRHRRLRRARARRRRRRHLARQHLPRLRVRRAVAPLLVLVRAQPGLDAHASRRSRRSGPTCARVRRALRRARRTSASATRSRTPRWDERRAALAPRDRRSGDAHRATCSSPASAPLSEPSIPDIPGLETLRRARSSTRRAGTTTTTSPASASRSIGTGASAIQFVPRDPAAGRRSCTLFQRTPPWVMPRRDRPITRASSALYRALARSRSGSCARGIYWAREMLVLGFVDDPRLMRGRRAARRAAPAQRRSADPELRAQAHAATTRSAASASCSPTTTTPRSREPNVEVVTDGIARGPRARDRHRRRRRARGRRDHLRHRLPRHRHADRRARRAAATGARSAEVWRGSPQAYLGHHRRRLPEPVPAARPQHRPRPQLDGLHDRVADRLRARRPAHDGRARAAPRVEVRPEAQDALQRRASSSGMQRHGLDHRRLRELVPRRPRPQLHAAY